MFTFVKGSIEEVQAELAGLAAFDKTLRKQRNEMLVHYRAQMQALKNEQKLLKADVAYAKELLKKAESGGNARKIQDAKEVLKRRKDKAQDCHTNINILRSDIAKTQANLDNHSGERGLLPKVVPVYVGHDDYGGYDALIDWNFLQEVLRKLKDMRVNIGTKSHGNGRALSIEYSKVFGNGTGSFTLYPLSEEHYVTNLAKIPRAVVD